LCLVSCEASLYKYMQYIMKGNTIIMASNRYFKGTTRETNEARNTIQTENRRHNDTGSGYHPVSRERAVQYASDVQNLFSGLNRDKDINKAFDIIQSEKNHLLRKGNVKGKHYEIYHTLDRLQDAILDENQGDIADIVSSVRISSRTSSTVRGSLDSIIKDMQQYNNRRQNRETRDNQLQHRERTQQRTNERGNLDIAQSQQLSTETSSSATRRDRRTDPWTDEHVRRAATKNRSRGNPLDQLMDIQVTNNASYAPETSSTPQNSGNNNDNRRNTDTARLSTNTQRYKRIDWTTPITENMGDATVRKSVTSESNSITRDRANQALRDPIVRERQRQAVIASHKRRYSQNRQQGDFPDADNMGYDNTGEN